jgi:hypothetical protein
MRIRIRNLAENSQQIWIVARVRNRSDLLRLRFQFLLWKSFGSGSGSGSGCGQFLIQTYLTQLYKNMYKILPFQ